MNKFKELIKYIKKKYKIKKKNFIAIILPIKF